jgi:uridine kinase
MYNLLMEGDVGGGMKENAIKLNDEQLVGYITGYLKEIDKKETKIIALIGGPASGKGTLAERLAVSLGRTVVLSTDNYLKGDRVWRRTNVENEGKDPVLKYDQDYLNEQIRKIIQLQDGQEMGIPIYDGSSGVAINSNPEIKPDDSIYPKKIKGRQGFVIIEGDFQFVEPDLIDRIIFLDVDDDVRLENRLYRDSIERREDKDKRLNEEKIKANFNLRQATQFLPYTLPQKEKADMVIKVHAAPLEHPVPKAKFSYSYDITQKQN